MECDSSSTDEENLEQNNRDESRLSAASPAPLKTEAFKALHAELTNSNRHNHIYDSVLGCHHFTSEDHTKLGADLCHVLHKAFIKKVGNTLSKATSITLTKHLQKIYGKK